MKVDHAQTNSSVHYAYMKVDRTDMIERIDFTSFFSKKYEIFL